MRMNRGSLPFYFSKLSRKCREVVWTACWKWRGRVWRCSQTSSVDCSSYVLFLRPCPPNTCHERDTADSTDNAALHLLLLWSTYIHLMMPLLGIMKSLFLSIAFCMEKLRYSQTSGFKLNLSLEVVRVLQHSSSKAIFSIRNDGKWINLFPAPQNTHVNFQNKKK